MRKRWDSKSEIGIFVGYGENTKGYRVYFPEKNIVSIKRDIIFINEIKENKGNNLTQEKENEIEVPTLVEEEVKQQNDRTIEQEIEEGQSNEDLKSEEEEQNEEIETSQKNEKETENKRKRKQPVWLDDYETNFLSIYNEPTSYQEAMEGKDRENWSEAIQRELNTLKQNNTWTEIADYPEDTQIVSSKWVFKIKENSNGSKQYKARLVARGFEQTDCDLQIYAPVARLTTFRLFMVVANKMKLPVYQLDVTGAFLYGDIKETVYMKLPNGTLCKLNRSIYGLKKILQKIGMKNSILL